MRFSSVVPFGVAGILTLVGVVAYLPLAAHAQFFGPIISTVCNCDPVGGITANGVYVPYSAPAWGCILDTFQNFMTFGVSVAVVIITIFIAWAGFTYMTSGSNAEKRGLANKRIMNAVIGLVIVLCAYLIVDSLMKIIYNPSAPNLGPWNSILAGSGAADCLAPVKTPTALPGITAAINPGAAGAPTQTGAVPAAGTDNGPGACNASAVQSGAAAGGYNISTPEADTLACIAGAESTCGTNNNTSAGSSARGAWQVLMQTNSNCYNNSACEAAVHATGPLNCSAGFSGGNSLNNSTSQICTQAAGNLNCSASAAACLAQQNSSNLYAPWIPPANPQGAKQLACVQQYSGG